MEIQLTLFKKKPKMQVEPEVRVVKNSYMTAGGLVTEETIKKIWFYPTRKDFIIVNRKERA